MTKIIKSEIDIDFVSESITVQKDKIK